MDLLPSISGVKIGLFVPFQYQ